jgi:hypothetical protein
MFGEKENLLATWLEMQKRFFLCQGIHFPSRIYTNPFQINLKKTTKMPTPFFTIPLSVLHNYPHAISYCSGSANWRRDT